MTTHPPSPPDPPDDDDTLWKQAMRDVSPLPGDEQKTILQPQPDPLRIRPRSRQTVPAADPVLNEAPGPGLDRRTAQRLQQGRMNIEGRIDLHGHTLPQAHAALERFIRSHAARGSRCLLVITGKGETRAGAETPWYEAPAGTIRSQLSLWLEDPSLAPLILSVAPARPPHGGSGAFYVLLRRRRGT